MLHASSSHLPPNANAWAEIDLAALAHNAQALQSLGPRLMAVLKADAYGHGMEIVASELMRIGVRDYGVATASEGARLRGLVRDGARIYIMTAFAPQDAESIVSHALTPFVSSRGALRWLQDAAMAKDRTVHAHLEVDTGIGRAGLLPDEFPAALDEALSLPNVEMTGICTHFTWGENAEDARAQHALFERVLSGVVADLLGRLTIHAANSPATLNVPGARYGMIRPGLLLYGIAPVGGAPAALPGGSPLRPVLSLRARVILVRDLPAGASISYGRTFVLNHPARIATVGIGYGDGYFRRLSSCGSVLLPGGAAAPIRGRVCMDQFCVELPAGADLSPGDTVTLVGRDGENELRAADIADLIGATPHEITTCLTRRVPRVV